MASAGNPTWFPFKKNSILCRVCLTLVFYFLLFNAILHHPRPHALSKRMPFSKSLAAQPARSKCLGIATRWWCPKSPILSPPPRRTLIRGTVAFPEILWGRRGIQNHPVIVKPIRNARRQHMRRTPIARQLHRRRTSLGSRPPADDFPTSRRPAGRPVDGPPPAAAHHSGITLGCVWAVSGLCLGCIWVMLVIIWALSG